VHFHGVLPATGIFAFGDYIQGSGATDARDSQIGSVGGGNHFVELQVIDEVLEGATAHAWGVAPGSAAIMAHSGKDITPVVQTIENAGVARRVARLWPLLTIKG
jgi:tRNA-splicing ligase RtcB